MCPCENGDTQQVTYIRFSAGYFPSTDSGGDRFALILQNNPQYQLRRSVSYGFDRRTTNQPVFFVKSHV